MNIWGKGVEGRCAARRLSFDSLYVFLNFYFFPSTQRGLPFLIPFTLFNNCIFSLRRAQAARGPYFLLLQKVGKDRRKGVSPPCESPDQSGVLDAPLWKPPSPRWRGRPGRTPRRLRGWSFGAVGEGRERLRARHGRRTSTASFGGLRPLAPCVPQRGKFAGHARRRMVPRSFWLCGQRLRKSPGSSCRASG